MFTCMQVFDEDNNDVTPQPLQQPDAGSQTTISSLLFDENSADHTADTGSIFGPLFRYHSIYCQLTGAALTA